MIILVVLLGAILLVSYSSLILRQNELEAINKTLVLNEELNNTRYYYLEEAKWGTCHHEKCAETFTETDQFKVGDQMAIKMTRTTKQVVSIDWDIALRQYQNDAIIKSQDDKKLKLGSTLQAGESMTVVSPRPIDYLSHAGRYVEVIEGEYIVVNDAGQKTVNVYIQSPVLTVQ